MRQRILGQFFEAAGWWCMVVTDFWIAIRNEGSE